MSRPLQRHYVQVLLQRRLPQPQEVDELALRVDPESGGQHLPVSTRQRHSTAEATVHQSVCHTIVMYERGDEGSVRILLRIK